MERGLASVFKLAVTFCKHLCAAQAAFLDQALPSPPTRRVSVSASSHLTVRLLYQKALQWWLGVPRTAGKSDHYLGKRRKGSFPPAGTPVRKLPSFFLVIVLRSETKICQQLKSKDLHGGIRCKVMAPFSGYRALRPSPETWVSFLLFVSSKHQNSEAA